MEGVGRVVVNPVVARSTDCSHVVRVEDVAASGASQDFMDVDGEATASVRRVLRVNRGTCFALCSHGEYLLDELSAGYRHLLAFL